MEFIGKLKTYTSNELKERNRHSMISIGFECLDREMFHADKCYEPLAESGVRYARVQTGWAKCETEKGVIDFAWLDDIVDKLLAGGIQPWFNVGFGNRVYMNDVAEGNKMAVGCVPLYYGDECLNAWKNFVRKLTEHYRDRITHYEIWNEPDVTAFWYPSTPDASQLAKLIDLTADIILDIQPEAKIGTCVAGIANLNAGYHYPKLLLQSLSHKLDFFCVHRYALIPELNWADSMIYMEKLLVRYGHVNAELWMGEGGYPSWFPANHWLHPRAENEGTEHQQAVFMARRIMNDASLGLCMHSYFQIADMWERPYAKARDVIAKPAAQGILNGKVYTKKLSYYVISRLATLLEDVRPLQDISMRIWFKDTPEAILSVQKYALVKDGQPMYVWYAPTDIQDERGQVCEMQLACETFADVKPIRKPVVIDPLTGDVFAVDGKFTTDGWVGNVPLCEYPLILCDASLFLV